MSSPLPPCKQTVVIDEARCIGCTLCIKACPFDAIIGAAKHMHTVITQYCTGCALCIPPCPMDCIEIIENPDFEQSTREQRHLFAHEAKQRVTQRKARLQEKEQAIKDAYEKKKNVLSADLLKQLKSKSTH